MRKRLSRLKGGRLAHLSHANRTIALILSDVIGNQLDVIASGPTVESNDPEDQGWKIIKKYRLENQLPARVSEVLSSPLPPSRIPDRDGFSSTNVQNFLIGSNITALEAAKSQAIVRGFATAIIGDQICGEAREVGQHFAQLSRVVTQMLTDRKSNQHEHMETLSLAAENLGIDPRFCCKLERLIRSCQLNRKGLCLIGGGETTVTVQGTGVGGRNQEMVLSFLIDTAKDEITSELNVVFLSAGTDGLDGPTSAAGAVACQGIFKEAITQGLDPKEYLSRNDSFTFFQHLKKGFYHIVTGPSGTNVMDVHVLYFDWN